MKTYELEFEVSEGPVKMGFTASSDREALKEALARVPEVARKITLYRAISDSYGRLVLWLEDLS